MAEASRVVALAAIALCFSSLLGSAYCQGDSLMVIGGVICDPCRVSFETTVSYPLAGSLVRMEYTNRTNRVLKHAFETKTDSNGVHQLSVDGDHEEEICQVRAVVSSDPECSSQAPEVINNGRISLTKNSGVSESTRHANALFYAPEKRLKSCPKILLDMGILPPGDTTTSTTRSFYMGETITFHDPLMVFESILLFLGGLFDRFQLRKLDVIVTLFCSSSLNFEDILIR